MKDPKTFTNQELEDEIELNKSVAERLCDEDMYRRVLREEKSRRLREIEEKGGGI